MVPVRLWLVRYLENFRQNDQEILNKSGWGPAKRAPVIAHYLPGARFAGPQPHTLSATFLVPACLGYYETTASIRGRRVDRYAGTFFIYWGDETLNMNVTCREQISEGIFP
uniref:Uncharacterized protein n=1 Tax=Candidatus Kentrum sp. LPFa TaxID=2126335 RepID=A0A450WD43_9GAMM|nr:MAG: hypothetical protein BECKLPF1236A_GA0070988_101169 [Candidatus Kentron sp. LPFa]